jgi:hypothetical protein
MQHELCSESHGRGLEGFQILVGLGLSQIETIV